MKRTTPTNERILVRTPDTNSLAIRELRARILLRQSRLVTTGRVRIGAVHSLAKHAPMGDGQSGIRPSLNLLDRIANNRIFFRLRSLDY